MTPKPVTDSKGKLDCSNPRVSCISSELKEETPGFNTGCKGKDGTKNPDEIPSMTDLFAKSEELFCQQNPLAGKCLKKLEFSPTGRYCKENPFSAKCLKHFDGVNPIFRGRDNPISIPVHGADLGSPICKLYPNLAQCKKVAPTRLIPPSWK
ncbi:MAG: hypothetical protein H7318_19040 [Oligoflexus sp.]|nr:hypothetical protein [Oligoflexus sp.]